MFTKLEDHSTVTTFMIFFDHGLNSILNDKYDRLISALKLATLSRVQMD